MAGEALGRRKRESRIVNEKRRAKRRTFMMDEDGDNKNDEDDNGEGYAEAVATIEKKAQVESLRETTKQSRHRFGRPSEAELTAASRKKIPEKKVMSFLTFPWPLKRRSHIPSAPPPSSQPRTVPFTVPFPLAFTPQ